MSRTPKYDAAAKEVAVEEILKIIPGLLAGGSFRLVHSVPDCKLVYKLKPRKLTPP